jgi:cytochrome b561
MTNPVSVPRYPGAIQAIHWTTAGLIVCVVVFAWLWPDGPAKDGSALLLLHRSLGLTILALTVLRLGLRTTMPVPAEPDAASRLESLVARITHVTLYAILLIMPITGFLWTTSRGRPVSVFGLFDIPPLLPPSETLHSIVRAIHSAGQYAVYAVVGLHVAAALFHLVVRRDDVMARMWPGMRVTPRLNGDANSSLQRIVTERRV